MAGKYALYFPYKTIDALQAGKVSDSEFRRFIIALVNYDRRKELPAFDNSGLAMLFESLKPEIDVAREKYTAAIERNREKGSQGGKSSSEAKQAAARNNGKRGGAPFGNQNAAKKLKQPKQVLGLNKTTSTPEKQPKNNPSGEFDCNSLSGNELQNQKQPKQNRTDKDKNSCSGVVFSKQPTTTTTESILQTCEETGFPMTKSGAQRIQGMGIDPEWLAGPFNFIKSTIEYVQKIYDDKPPEEQKRLFFSALEWEDRQEEFPAW